MFTLINTNLSCYWVFVGNTFLVTTNTSKREFSVTHKDQLSNTDKKIPGTRLMDIETKSFNVDTNVLTRKGRIQVSQPETLRET